MYTAKTILIAEDDSSIRELLEESLNSLYDVISVDNGYSAYIKASEENPGLILLDLFLPRMDGITVVKKLKANDRTKNIPILVVSAHNKKELIVTLLKLGVRHFLAKPFEINNLVKRVGELYQDSAAASDLANLKIKYSPNSNILNVKLVGDLVTNDSPVLINDISHQINKDIEKIILHINDLDSFGMDQVAAIERVKEYFKENDIGFHVSAGHSTSLRANLLKNSVLKDNLLTN